jgi:hypothetical protein
MQHSLPSQNSRGKAPQAPRGQTIALSASVRLPKRAKLGISDAQKQALRIYWAETKPKPTQRACAEWFQSQFGRLIDRATVSRILSSKYDHLDIGPVGASKRTSSSYWPELDQKVFEWADRHINAGIPITGPLLQYKAIEYWRKIPIYNHLPMPLFSDGWNTRFKQRHSLRYHTFHGEAGSVPALIHDQIKPIQAICKQYRP